MQTYTNWSKMILLLLTILIVLVGCGKKDESSTVKWTIQDFNFTDQEGNPFGLADLKGKVWIADFIFTHCKTVCPPMTANMKKLQDLLKSRELDVEIVSFSVDPEVDTPQKLKEYASKFAADFSNWHLLTGYTQEEIGKFAKESFQTLAEKPSGDDQVIHGTYFYLIDQEGNVVAYYDGNMETPFEKISKDVESLLK